MGEPDARLDATLATAIDRANKFFEQDSGMLLAALPEHGSLLPSASICLSFTEEVGYDTHSSVRVWSPYCGAPMRLIRSRDVPALTGLTADQLREWTVRRRLIQPDEPAQKRGSEAKFSWQTLLVLRLAVALRIGFHVELQAHRELLASARKLLDGASFLGLWGGTLAVYGLARCELLSARTPPASVEEDAILLRLNRHLDALSQGLGFTEPVSQLSLFTAVGLKGAGEGAPAEFRRAEGARA